MDRMAWQTWVEGTSESYLPFKPPFEVISYLDAPGRKLGSMVRINGLFHLLIDGVYWGYILWGSDE